MVNSSNTDDETLEEDERTHCPLLLTKSFYCKFIGNPEPMVGQGKATFEAWRLTCLT